MRVRNLVLAMAAVSLAGFFVYQQCSTERGGSARPDTTTRTDAGSRPRVAKQPVVQPAPASPAVQDPEVRATPSNDEQTPSFRDLTELSDEERETARLVEKVEEINLLYDRSDYAAVVARSRATLDEFPDNIRLLRKLVASSCIIGDAEVASEYYPRITTPVDREHVERVCAQNGIDLADDD